MQKHGFNLALERELKEAGGTARLWIHDKTGAQLLSIVNDDENKCFGVSFFTPPTDSTGVAHILEHSVLCGSVKYPVKEPFVELLKGSLQTFLNAFTFPDKTCYPVASANLQDFYNLIEVYLDAVFHPLISRDTFAQEGWHVEAENADTPWTFKGVVYNEMKGVYSTPESILAEQSQQAVFPDNLYSLDSGGNPECIPDLTYETFRDFHARYYQPGNARFFFWGNDPEEQRLEIIANAVKGYGRTGKLPQINLQKPYSEPRAKQVSYAASQGEQRAMCAINWLLPPRGDVEKALTLAMLQHILEGLPGSPLRRALMESGLGEDTIGGGLEEDLRQMYYSTGLKGINPDDARRVEELALKTLAGLADNGIDPEAVEAALNSVEFAYREANTGRLPRGLVAMIQSLSTWLYDEDPLAPLAWEAPLAKIKKQISAGEKIFEQAIRDYFLNNPHRVTVTLLPDSSLAKKREDAEKTRLCKIQEQCDPEKRAAVVDDTIRLQKAQLTPDKPEDLAKIPTLGIKDLPLKNAHVPREIKNIPQTFISHDLPTRGVAYCTLLMPIASLPRHLLPYLSLFERVLLECGSAKYDYSQLGMKIASKTGGLGASIISGLKFPQRSPFLYLGISGKAVYDKISSLFDLMREILLEPVRDTQIKIRRLSQMILEDKARMEYGLQMAGNATASMRIGAHYTGSAAITEQLNGPSQLEFLRQLADGLEKDPDAILANFEELRQLTVSSTGAIFDCAAESAILSEIERQASQLLSILPSGNHSNGGEVISDYPPDSSLPSAEAFITPGLINYVGKGANLYDLGYDYDGSINVITRWLRMGPLWEEVRVAGGAYGVSCSFDRIGGNFVCTSYRDPNVSRTLNVYDSLGAYLRDHTPGKAQLDQAIVGAIGDLDTYMLPDARAAKSLSLWLAGINEETRQQTRDEILSTTARDFKKFADVMDSVAANGDICVVGGAAAEAIAMENEWRTHKLV